MSDYIIPLSEQVRDLERSARNLREFAATLRRTANHHESRALGMDTKIRDLKAQIAAGGARQEALFGEQA